MEKNNNKIMVQKASGEKEPFDRKKLIRSLKNAGTDEKTVQKVVTEVEQWMTDGVSTKKLYTQAYRILNKKNAVSALRYKLKKALMELGPTGYPFEHFIGALFEKQGYHILVSQMVEGQCVFHEMDVIATRGESQSLVECKYANNQSSRISIQVPLYVRARVDDIIAKRKQSNAYNGFNFTGWVVTNSRFTSESEQYAKCCGLQLLGWDYPKGYGLKDIIEKVKIFPVTILSQLTKKQKTLLMDKGIVTCSYLLREKEVIKELSLTKNKERKLMEQLQAISET